MEWTNNKLPERLPERLPFSKKRLPKRVIFSYVLDYIIIFALIVTFTIVDKIEPFHQPFSLDNLSLRYPFAEHERIPVPMLCIICVGAPAVIIAFYTLIIDGIFSHQTPMPANSRGLRRLSGRYRLKDRLWELNCGILGLGLSVMLAFTITGALKNAIGKPRPDILDRCKIVDDLKLKSARKVGDDRWPLYTIEICTQSDNALLQDGFKSFPSGHSSTAFAGLFYLSLYLAAKLHVLDSKGEVWKSFLVLVPTLAAAVVAGSRIMDARHHPFDVLFGASMGILVAIASYRQYFPPLSETWRKGRAYPIRSWGREPQAPQNPTILVDEDVEPLRRRPTDIEEQAAASGFTSQTALAGGNGGNGENVFRQQINQSQRRRQEEARPYQLQQTDTMGSTLSKKVTGYQSQMPSSSPYTADPRHHDAYDYSSSDEDDNYELQQTYNNPSNPSRGPVYDPVSGSYTETGYQSPAAGINPHPTPPPPANLRPFPTTGESGDSRTQQGPAVPPHAPGTAS